MTEVTDACRVEQLVGTAGESDIVVLLQCNVTDTLVPPVSALRVSDVLDALVSSGTAVIGIAHLVYFFVFRSLGNIGFAERLEALRDRSLELHGTLTAFLGGDEDDAIGASCTIDSLSGSVLEHLHALDVVLVEKVDVGTHRHAVDDIERVRAVDGADASDDDTWCGARSTAVGHLHTIDLALQSVHDVASSEFVELIAFDSRDGAGQIAFLGDTITDDHHLVEVRGIVLHHDVDSSASGDSDLL